LQLLGPVVGEHAAPVVHGSQRVEVGAVFHLASLATHVDKINAEQHLQMFRDRRLVQLERVGNFVHRTFTVADELKNVSSPRFGDGVKRIGGEGGRVS